MFINEEGVPGGYTLHINNVANEGKLLWHDRFLAIVRQSVARRFSRCCDVSPLLGPHYRMLTETPHIAGSDENKRLAETIYKQWRDDYKFDEVELVNYTVLLSYPNTSNPNVLQLETDNGTVLHSVNTEQEPPLTPGENDTDVVSPFNAYAGAGSAKVRHDKQV